MMIRSMMASFVHRVFRFVSLRRRTWDIGKLRLFMTLLVVLALHRFFAHTTDIYKTTPMCSPTAAGLCGELSDIPSPRTVYSARSRQQYETWWTAHAALNESAAAYVSRRKNAQQRQQSKPPLVLLGDSITESWLGTDMGKKIKRCEGIPEVLREVLATDQWDPLVLAIGGDQTQHLLWRLQHGELLAEIANDPSAVFVVMIGTNNLGSGMLPTHTQAGILAVADYLLEHTAGKLVLLELLPRGDSQRLKRLCPPRCTSRNKPFQSFMPAVDKVNEGIRNAMPERSRNYDGRFNLVDCGAPFRHVARKNSETDEVVLTELMPDQLHPNAKGHRLLATCILHCIGGNC